MMREIRLYYCTPEDIVYVQENTVRFGQIGLSKGDQMYFTERSLR